MAFIRADDGAYICQVFLSNRFQVMDEKWQDSVLLFKRFGENWI